MRVYLCGPIMGCTDEEAVDWRENAKVVLGLAGVKLLDPMRRDYRGRELANVREIVEEDKIDIENSDVILVNYPKPSVGTSMEVFMAWTANKRVIVVHPYDVTLSPWLVYHSHDRYTNWEDSFKKILELNMEAVD